LKVAVINFSGNVGKSTVAKHLLLPRIPGAEFVAVESINADEHDGDTMKGKQFGALSEQLMLLENVIVDVGSSNVEDFMRLMKQYQGSHEDFDVFVVPVVKENKQMGDTMSTITALAALGVPAKKIRLIFNRVEVDDVIEDVFYPLFAFHEETKSFTLRPRAAIQFSELYQKLRPTNLTIPGILADATDFKAILATAKTAEAKTDAASRISMRRLAASAQMNLDAVFASTVTRI
jgi:hypothetical protein